MKVATWNVNSLTARWVRVEEWLTTHDVDVVLLQETKQNDAKFPFDAFTALGYESAHLGQGQWNGVAILSKIGLSDVERGLGDDAEARFIGATCGPLRVYSCYVPNGRSLDNDHYQYKLKWLSDLATHLRARPNDQRIVVGGDFNVAPSDLDVYDPAAFVGATHVSEPERAAITELIDTGLVDIVREQHPGEPCFSWWDYRNGCFRRGWGLRIDLLLLDPVSAAATTSSYVDRDARKGEKPSDHAPVVVEIDDVL